MPLLQLVSVLALAASGAGAEAIQQPPLQAGMQPPSVLAEAPAELAFPSQDGGSPIRSAATSTAAAAVDPPVVASSPLTAATPAGDPSPSEWMTIDEMRAEMKKLAWTKGDYTITPYGTLWGNMNYETQRTNAGSYVLYVLSPSTDPGPDFRADARSTRLGFDVLGPRIACLDNAQSGGRVEIDFQRTIDTENKAGLLLRHAYVEVKNEDFRLLAGQTWDVISPLNPDMLMYTVGWDGGNIGYRRAQFRGERYLACSDTLKIVAQGSLNADIISDTITGMTPYPSSWPLIEGRLAAILGPRGKDCQPMEFGVSSHIGEYEYEYTVAGAPANYDRRTWSLNVDARVPLTSRLGVEGELYTGENLATFYGGIGQGIDPNTRNTIRSQGGWIEVWYDLACDLHTHAGYGLDDPFDSDVTTATGRIYNSFIFANITYDLTPKFQVGIETSYWKTLYNSPTLAGESVNTEFCVKYGF